MAPDGSFGQGGHTLANLTHGQLLALKLVKGGAGQLRHLSMK